MTDYTSQATGDWHTNTTWAPIGIPDAGDTVTIEDGDVVTLSTEQSITSIYNSGGLILAADLEMDDTMNSYIRCTDTGYIDVSGATYGAPRVIRSAATSPLRNWGFRIDNTTDTDDRAFDLEFLECQDNNWFLGNSTYLLWFNSTKSSTPSETEWLDAAPMVHDPRIQENICEGRAGGRVYYLGAGAGAISLSGRMLWDKYNWQVLSKWARDGSPVALVSNFVHCHRGYLEAPRFRPSQGSRYIDFSVTLVEDK
jgi:hypothetical protein